MDTLKRSRAARWAAAVAVLTITALLWRPFLHVHAYDAHKNFAASTVATAPSTCTAGTSLVVQPGDGAKFPAAPFNASVWPANVNATSANAEIVRVTLISTDTFTITRTAEPGGINRCILVGDQIAATITAKTITDIEATAGVSQSFRSLYLRTHPDADKAANQVDLISAAEIVTDKGQRVNPRANLTADITTSGFGGLDTSTRTASTWYSVRYVFKGLSATSPDSPTSPTSDGLIFHREKNFALDQSAQTGGVLSIHVNDLSTNQKIAQSFTAGITGNVEIADVRLFKVGSPVGNMRFALTSDSTGPGTTLATSDAIDVSTLPTSPVTIRMVFRSPTSITNGTKYWLVATPSYTTSASNYVVWDGNNTGSGVDQFNGTTWSAVTNATTWFKVYVTQNSTAVTLPSGYTDQALIGYVYNSSGNVLQAFVARDRYVRTLVLESFTSSSTLFSVIDDSAVIPPIPVSVEFSVTNNTAGDSANQMSGVPDGYGNAQANVGASGLINADVPAANERMYIGRVFTEYQGVYALATAGTATFYHHGYQW